jgi:hypothetical protein
MQRCALPAPIGAELVEPRHRLNGSRLELAPET